MATTEIFEFYTDVYDKTFLMKKYLFLFGMNQCCSAEKKVLPSELEDAANVPIFVWGV
jgi:hypothetical protein